MDPQRFDALTRRLGFAASRRTVLPALFTGALMTVVGGSEADEVAAACKGFNAKCKRHANCCANEGLRCVKVGKGGKGKKRRKRCRCQNGTCPAQTPCCIRGKCEELCDGECCADCFVQITNPNGTPDPNSDECCPADRICGPNPKKLSDDRCCLGGEECVEGTCCRNNGSLGSIVCGGKCCAQDACCNGSCCPVGTFCAGNQCVSATRGCGGGNPPCLAGESCHGGVCCSDLRMCINQMGNDICCPAGTFCEQEGSSQACCPINATCNTYKPNRVRR